MTPENTFNVKPLTNLHYVAATNPSGEQLGRNRRRYKRRTTDQQPEISEENIGDDGGDTLHVIDYCA